MRNSDGLDEVSIGRGPQRARVREWEGGVARLRLTVPDGFMSSQHLRLVRVGERWRAEDAGSKNGSFLGEAPLDEPALLADRALLTTGRTIFLFLRAAGASGRARRFYTWPGTQGVSGNARGRHKLTQRE